METQSTVTGARVERRYWRRTETPAAWWPWGVLPLFGLVLVFAYGLLGTAPHIQTEVQSEVAVQLRESGIAVRDLRVSGQGVALIADAEDDQENRIRAMAESADCDTWAGRLNCPTTVEVALVAPHSGSPEVELVEASLMARRAHDFVFEKIADEVTLSGEVPNEEERKRIVGLADANFDKVVDRLSVSDEATTKQYLLAIDRALAVLAKLARGQVTWTGGVFDASGVATADDANAARSLFNDTTNSPKLGQIQIQVAEQLHRCNEDFRQALSDSTIRFRTGSTIIDSGNDVLLQRLAELASACPGNLTIAGHTDSLGDEDMNRSLSLGRASAVRDALISLGVESDRINATGLGESQPIADNASAEGRATNRRIVISIDEMS